MYFCISSLSPFGVSLLRYVNKWHNMLTLDGGREQQQTYNAS